MIKGLFETHLLGRGTDEAIIHTWMPAAAYYFDDPDGNELEFITLLDDKPMQLSYTPYLSEWKEEITKK